jgi:hypothetical protein
MSLSEEVDIFGVRRLVAALRQSADSSAPCGHRRNKHCGFAKWTSITKLCVKNCGKYTSDAHLFTCTVPTSRHSAIKAATSRRTPKLGISKLNTIRPIGLGR